MKALGRHILAELSDCNPQILGNLRQVERILVEAAKRAKAQVREVVFHKFSPQGVSGVVVIAESHLAIHTWPEHQYAAIDIYTCGESTDPMLACAYVASQFRAAKVATTIVDRGIETSDGWYGHSIFSCFNRNPVPHFSHDKSCNVSVECCSYLPDLEEKSGQTS